MRITKAAVTEDDVAYVLAHPWQTSAEELAAFDLTFDQCTRAVEAIWGRSQYASALLAGGLTVAIMGAYRVDDGMWKTWFLASEEFPKHGRAATVAAGELLQGVFSEQKQISMVATSASAREDAGRWFCLLGF